MSCYHFLANVGGIVLISLAVCIACRISMTRSPSSTDLYFLRCSCIIDYECEVHSTTITVLCKANLKFWHLVRIACGFPDQNRAPLNED
jgi:hypothetical protein